MVDALTGAFTLIPIIIAIYYAGELVWRDRERRMHEIVDATAAPDWAFIAPKVLAITLVLLATFCRGHAGRGRVPARPRLHPVGANYREAFRARSKPEFISKCGDCLKEVEETAYWLELLVEGDLMAAEKLAPLRQECDELTAIFVSIVKSSRRPPTS